jgi:hypothetical protein
MAFSDFRQVPPRLPRRRDSPPRPQRISPDYPHHHSNVPCPLPRWTEMGAHVGCFPTRSGLPRTAVGSASTSSLSRPAQASRVLRPAGSLSRPAAAFVTRLRPGWLPDQVARQLPVQPTILWVEPPSTGVTRLRGALLSKKVFLAGELNFSAPPARLMRAHVRDHIESQEINHRASYVSY